jgi:hypothetical protein
VTSVVLAPAENPFYREEQRGLTESGLQPWQDEMQDCGEAGDGPQRAE